ncbi:MAG: glycine zipper family protein [Gammaproteobacteria bacterium]|nr:MAG: glycine zipper family protein [Gammaproteobacteria bacterium]RLA51781.1 MAG: glycine zipper family protein [Gammaproteobacteria bacterium]
MKKSALIIGMATALITLPLHANVIIDPEGVEMGQYQRDLNECHQISQQVQRTGASSALKGAALGGALGAITGNSSRAKKAAGAGAVVGGVGSRASTNAERDRVVKNCIRNKGYTVLN